jgi:hypothetical protein
MKQRRLTLERSVRKLNEESASPENVVDGKRRRETARDDAGLRREVLGERATEAETRRMRTVRGIR